MKVQGGEVNEVLHSQEMWLSKSQVRGLVWGPRLDGLSHLLASMCRGNVVVL